MSEIYLQPSPVQYEQSLQSSEVLKASQIIDTIDDRGIVIDDREAVESSLETLQQEFGIQNEAFDDLTNTLVITAAASKLASIEADDSLSPSERRKGMEHVADIVMGVAGEFTAFDSIDMGTSVDRYVPSDERQKEIYEKYAHPELSAELSAFIHGPALDEVRRRLGVEGGEEDPYEVKVLSIDIGDTDDLVPNVDYGDNEHTYEELKKEEASRNDYKKGLSDRSESFVADMGREEVPAPAWVTTFDDGSKYLVVSSALAEKVLYTDEERPGYYQDADYERDIALLTHEYTHTQGMLTGGKVGPGIALEELRAEHFSGNKHGYTDIKNFFVGIGMLTGYHPANSFEIDGTPYNQDEALVDIAKNIGLDGLLDCMTAIPGNYAEDESASPFIKGIVAGNGGGLSAQFQKVYDKEVAKHGHEKIDDQISSFVDKVYNSLKGNKYITVESWFDYGDVASFRDIGIENFRRRYPDASNGYDYSE